MTDTSCSAERPPNSNATRSLSAMSWSPESARSAGTSPKGAGLVNRPRWAGQRQAKGARAKRGRGDAERCAARDALGVIDRGPAANGVDPLDELRYTEVKNAGDW